MKALRIKFKISPDVYGSQGPAGDLLHGHSPWTRMFSSTLDFRVSG